MNEIFRRPALGAGIALALSAAMSAHAAPLVLLTETGFGQGLISIDSANPGTPGSSLSFISGLNSGDRILGIDYRPADNQLFGLSSGNAIYTLDASSGAATLVGSGFSPFLNGDNFGFDFNPVIDRIRIVSDANQNLVGDPNTGAITVGTDTFYAAGDINEGADPNVVHHAYNGNVANSPATALFAIDTNLDVLVAQAASAGTLTTIGSLGVNATSIGGFDISSTDEAFAVFANIGSGTSTLYSINLTTGVASSLGHIGEVISGVAVAPAPIPLPAALPLFSLAGAGLLAVARKRKRA